MGNILNKPVLQEYISSGQSQMMADPTDYVDAMVIEKNIGI